MYIPKPIDTSEIQLPEELLELIELLAENTHDVWAAERIAGGWKYGPARDDRLKTSPCLVPYDQLPESEKAYDRNTSLAAIKAIIWLGYGISQPQDNEKQPWHSGRSGTP